MLLSVSLQFESPLPGCQVRLTFDPQSGKEISSWRLLSFLFFFFTFRQGKGYFIIPLLFGPRSSSMCILPRLGWNEKEGLSLANDDKTSQD